MDCGDGIEHCLIAFHQRRDRPVFVPLGDGPGFHRMGADPPVVAVTLQHQVDDAEVRAPEPAHHRGRPVERGVRGIHAGPAVIGGRGEDKVAVARQDRINAVDHPERGRGVFHHVLRFGGADARMAERDDDVGARFLHLRNEGLCRGDDVPRGDIAGEVALIPLHDLGRHESDEADPDRMRCARPVGHGPVEDHVWRHQRVVLGDVGPFGLCHVGADHREIGPGERLHQEVEPVVEFVVAQCRGVEAHRVHRRDDRVHVAVLHSPLIGDVVAHRVPLQEITVVEEDGVRRLGPDIGDMGRGARETHGVHRAVAVIVVGEDVDVKVRRFHDPKMRLVCLGPGRERMQHREGRGSGKKSTAAHGKVLDRHDTLPRIVIVTRDCPGSVTGV